MNTHTPGPWVWIEPLKVLNSAHGKIFDHAAYEGMWFATYKAKEDEANARLIAAAPCLLAAVELLVDVLEDGHWSETKGRLRELIAKATGATP